MSIPPSDPMKAEIQIGWTIIRWVLTAIVTALTALLHYYPSYHWITVAVYVLTLLGIHGVQTARQINH